MRDSSVFPCTSLYAELLSNIRQISVVASLSSSSDASSKAELALDERTISIHHQGFIRTLELPTYVAVRGKLSISPGARLLTWRLPVAGAITKVSAFTAENQVLPWSSTDLTVGSPITCRYCAHDIVLEDTVTEWKNLPSENWAEMMEFWHCHKPVDHGEANNEEHLTKRGYGASNLISAQASVGHVDLVSFIFSESDCQNIQFSLSGPEAGVDSSAQALQDAGDVRLLNVFCKCRAQVGSYNVLSTSVSLFKWQVLCHTISPAPTPSSLHCLAAALTATLSRSGSAKSVVIPCVTASQDPKVTDVEVALYLWVLNPNITYASSAIRGSRNAMKVLYQTITIDKAYEMIESMTSDVQDISLPSSVIKECQETLVMSNKLIPEGDQQFKEWSVGLLERWQPSESLQ